LSDSGHIEEDLQDLYENAPCGYLSLSADGRIVKANQTFLMTDFRSTGADSTVATLARDALATALQQTGFVRIMSPQAVADALTRMRLEPTVPVTLARAKEMARREGAVAIIDGEVRASGPGATLFVTVIAADSGTILSVTSEALGGPSDLLAAIDALARRLRSKSAAMRSRRSTIYSSFSDAPGRRMNSTSLN